MFNANNINDCVYVLIELLSGIDCYYQSRLITMELERGVRTSSIADWIIYAIDRGYLNASTYDFAAVNEVIKYIKTRTSFTTSPREITSRELVEIKIRRDISEAIDSMINTVFTYIPSIISRKDKWEYMFVIQLYTLLNDIYCGFLSFSLFDDDLVNSARETMDSIIQGGNYCSSKRKETQATIAEYQEWLADLHEKYGTKRTNYYEENHCLDQ